MWGRAVGSGLLHVVGDVHHVLAAMHHGVSSIDHARAVPQQAAHVCVRECIDTLRCESVVHHGVSSINHARAVPQHAANVCLCVCVFMKCECVALCFLMSL